MRSPRYRGSDVSRSKLWCSEVVSDLPLFIVLNVISSVIDCTGPLISLNVSLCFVMFVPESIICTKAVNDAGKLLYALLTGDPSN